MPHPLLAALALMLVHGWYPQSCCGDFHCHPVPCEELVEGRGGWVHIPTGTVFDDFRVQPSKDRFCHICIINGQGACAFIQMGT